MKKLLAGFMLLATFVIAFAALVVQSFWLGAMALLTFLSWVSFLAESTTKKQDTNEPD